MGAAAAAGNVDAIDKCIAAKEKLESKDASGGTALLIAAAAGHDRACRVLLSKHGASPFAKSPTGGTPLHLACQGGHTACVEALLFAGADVSAVNQAGKTSEQCAKAAGHKECRALFKRVAALPFFGQ